MKVSLTGGQLRVEKTFGPRGINHGPCGLICFYIQCVSLKLPLVGSYVLLCLYGWDWDLFFFTLCLLSHVGKPLLMLV